MARHAIIDQNGTVVNIVRWEGAEWLPPRNHTVVQSELGNIGDTYDFETNEFTKPVVQDEPSVDEASSLVGTENS